MAQAAGYRTPRFLTFKQALELGGNVRKGARGTKVYFVKQLHVRDDVTDDSSARLIPMMRDYTVFNVDQCENLPDSISRGSRSAFAIPTRATSLPMASCTQLARTSAKAMAKHFLFLAEILSRCRHSQGSGGRINSTMCRSTN
jgi:antirestriction protein ArdC